MPDSSISKFFEKSRKDRLKIIGNFANLSEDELITLENMNGGISFDKADKMIENAKSLNPHKRLTTTSDIGDFIELLKQYESSWRTGNIIRLDGGEYITG